MSFLDGTILTAAQLNAAFATANITGGTIDGAVIGGTAPAAGSFTTLSASTGITIATRTVPSISGSTTPGNVVVFGASGLIADGGAIPVGGQISGVNAQAGTTYTVVDGDKNKLVTFNNAAAVTVTLPQAGGSGAFLASWSAFFLNRGQGAVLINPTVSTIAGIGQIRLTQGQGVLIVSDGSNYLVLNGSAANYPGQNTNALGLRAVNAGGFNNSAIGDYCFVTGNTSTVSGTGAAAFGASHTIGTSGLYGFTAGNSNLIGNNYCVAFGNGCTLNTVGLSYGFAMGESIAVGGSYSVAFGKQTTDRNNVGALIVSGVNIGGSSTNRGRSQTEVHTFAASTSGATATRLTATGTAAAAGNVMALGTSSAVAFTAQITIVNTVTGGVATWSQALSIVTQGANAASTAMAAGNPAMVAGPTAGTAFTLQAAPTITADTTFGGINLSFTPPSGNSSAFYAVATIEATTTRWN